MLQMPLVGAAGTEFQSRLDEDAVRRGQPAADAGDRTERVTESIVLEALEAPPQREAEAALQVSVLPSAALPEEPGV